MRPLGFPTRVQVADRQIQASYVSLDTRRATIASLLVVADVAAVASFKRDPESNPECGLRKKALRMWCLSGGHTIDLTTSLYT